MKQDLSEDLGRGKATISGNTRTAGKEQYYTPSSTATELFQVALGLIPDLLDRTLVEPAAGTGSFTKVFANFGVKDIRAFDIEPKDPAIIQANFLQDECLESELTHGVAITNPPFGRNSSLSVPFFNRLADHCEYICFVIPKSWRKWTLQNRLDRRFHLIHDQELTIDYQDESGAYISQSGMLKTVFQIWKREEFLREKVAVPPSGLFEKSTPQAANASLTVFGRGCGTLKEDFPRKANTTQMFLLVRHPLGFEALRGANLAQFYNNVATVEALSWDELNFAVNEWMAAKGLELPSELREEGLF